MFGIDLPSVESTRVMASSEEELLTLCRVISSALKLLMLTVSLKESTRAPMSKSRLYRSSRGATISPTNSAAWRALVGTTCCNGLPNRSEMVVPSALKYVLFLSVARLVNDFN